MIESNRSGGRGGGGGSGDVPGTPMMFALLCSSFSLSVVINRVYSLALSLSPSTNVPCRIMALSTSTSVSRHVSATFPSTSAPASLCTARLIHSALVPPPGSTCTSVGPLDLTCSSLEGLSGLSGRCSSSSSSPGPSLMALDMVISTLCTLPHSLVLSTSSGGSADSSG